MTKNLKQLLSLLHDPKISGTDDLVITSVTHDSRQVIPGCLFICLSGAKVDGHDYIEQAQAAGAVAVLVERDSTVSGLTVIKVTDTRTAMQQITPFFYDYPAQKLRLIGVTGTNGKTTTTYIIKSILMHAGYKVGVIGTIQTIIGDKILPVKNTTPDVIELQSLLADMVAAGMDYAVMEVSSHALALGRVAGCEFDVGVFTNMTQDHLDFHHTFENYLTAKMELFHMLSLPGAKKPGKAAVINIDDPAGQTILDNTQCRTLTYAIKEPADLTAEHIQVTAKGASFVVQGSFGSLALQLKITGVFNVYNVLGAIGAAVAEGVDLNTIALALQEFESVTGRFELVTAGQDFSVIVDYAHTPDGLENILKTAKEFAQQRIIVVFGCGGDRDRTKRPIMGKLAAQYGDIVIATSDNPRTEDPNTILAEIEIGITAALRREQHYEKISDRRQAICRAIQLAAKDDVVIIAGKGHETYQILKDRTIAFDDREIARDCIREMK